MMIDGHYLTLGMWAEQGTLLFLSCLLLFPSMLNWLKRKGKRDGYKVREGGISTIMGDFTIIFQTETYQTIPSGFLTLNRHQELAPLLPPKFCSFVT